MDSTPRPGFHTLTPRIVTSDAAALVAYLRAVFDARGELHGDRPCELRMGDSLVWVSEAGPRDVHTAFLYMYVDDADARYARAIGAGATSLEAPVDTPYGDRRAMVRDAYGNVWQIAHVISKVQRSSAR
jgi:uncharacterized glyoxalase superfamily protein PhnB